MLIRTWRDFATETIRVHDLDPTYDFLHEAMKINGEDWVNRFALHYLMFYDLGEAARCANYGGIPFWNYVRSGYATFKRGTERRHSRGKLGEMYVENLAKHGEPGRILDMMWEPTYDKLGKRFNDTFKNCGFGPYFIWKVMDFQDRIFDRPIKLSLRDAVKYMPDEPRKCAAAVWPEEELPRVLAYVTNYIANLPFQAPGIPNRPCGFAEAETVLCMLKGYFLTKTHTIGDDLDSKYASLADFPDLLPLLPPQLNWSHYERGALDPSIVSAD